MFFDLRLLRNALDGKYDDLGDEEFIRLLASMERKQWTDHGRNWMTSGDNNEACIMVCRPGDVPGLWIEEWGCGMGELDGLTEEIVSMAPDCGVCGARMLTDPQAMGTYFLCVGCGSEIVVQWFRLPDGTLDWKLEQHTRLDDRGEPIDGEIDWAEAKAAERREFYRRRDESMESWGVKGEHMERIWRHCSVEIRALRGRA